MYADGSLDIAALAQSADEYVVKNDRRAFLPILRAIEQFAVDHNMIVGGRAGMIALHGLQPKQWHQNVDQWILEIYSLGIEADMRECLRTITEQMMSKKDFGESTTQKDPDEIYNGDPRTIVLSTGIPNREYMLWADYRLVAIGHSLGERKGIDISGIIGAVKGNGPFGTPNMLLMPSDIQIMRISHALCDPGIAGQWTSLFEQLEGLFAIKRGSYEGSRDDEIVSSAKIHLPPSAVLVGEHAIQHYTGAQIGKGARRQFVCSFDGLDDYIHREHMTSRSSDIRVPDDFRIRKAILRDRHDQVVADLFNVTSYEPVPVHKLPDGSLVAAPFMVLRMLFVDIWALSFVAAMMQDSAPIYRRQEFLRKLAGEMFAWIRAKFIGGQMSLLFPLEYEGIFVPERTAKLAVASMKSGRSSAHGPWSAVDKKDLVTLGDQIAQRAIII